MNKDTLLSDKTLIKCYRCKEMFKTVNYSGKDEDYKQKKWFCDECWGYEKLKSIGNKDAFNGSDDEILKEILNQFKSNTNTMNYMLIQNVVKQAITLTRQADNKKFRDAVLRLKDELKDWGTIDYAMRQPLTIMQIIDKIFGKEMTE